MRIRLEGEIMTGIVRGIVTWVLIAVMAMGAGVYADTAHNADGCARLTFIGHASVKLATSDGRVIYIDPYFPTNSYSEPADYILVTHSHSDHNAISLCARKDDCKVIRQTDALKNGDEYQTFTDNGLTIEAVPSGGGSNHNVKNCVGYIVSVDGVSLYHAGDVVMNDRMPALFGRDIDYAMYPVDGRYTMTPAQASELANLIGAKHNIPIHGDGDAYYSQALEFDADNKLMLIWGQTISLR